MGWKAKWALATVTGTLAAGLVGAAAAALDEFARLPFYHATAAAAALACAGSLAAVTLRDLRLPAVLGRRLLAGLRRPALVRPRAPRAAVAVTPEMAAALRKIHSVSWDFPPRAPKVGPQKQEASINYEVRH